MTEHKNETMNKFFVSLGLRSLAADQEAEIVEQAFRSIAARPGANEVDYSEVYRYWRQLGGHVPVIKYLVTEGLAPGVGHSNFQIQFCAALQVAILNGDFNQ